MRRILGVLGILVGLGGIAGIYMDRRAARQREDLLHSLAMHRQQTARPIQAGDRVRIASRAGTFKPEDTGATFEVVAGHGQTGVVLGRERPGIVRVRWEPQKWKRWLRDDWAQLPQFEATIHESYLTIVTPGS